MAISPLSVIGRVLGDPPRSGRLPAAVTEFELDTAGRRTAVAMYVTGARQLVPYVSDDRQVHVNGRSTTPRT